MYGFVNGDFISNDFEEITHSRYFVDKTALIDAINNLIRTSGKTICITRPGRFGKTTNAKMLASYYSIGANFKDVFDKLEISKCPSYLEHLNKHNVIYITFNTGSNGFETYKDYINFFTNGLITDLKEEFSDYLPSTIDKLPLSILLGNIFSKTQKGFVFIFDEWDYIFNKKLYTEKDRENFLEFLRDLIKNQPYVDLAYMTGVLPIAKYSDGSDLNVFDEYTFLNDNIYDKYFGFTEDEVKTLCSKQDVLTMDELKEWYNGYQTFTGLSIYNPRSVVYALTRGCCQSYWTNTGSMVGMMSYVQNNIDNIKDDVVTMLSGIPLRIDLSNFATENIELTTKEQVFSAMTIYGFLSYQHQNLFIPNKELRIKFADALKRANLGGFSEVISKSTAMVDATLRKDTKKMTQIIKEARSLYTPILKYNDKNSLACVLTLLYISALNDYTIKREEKAGDGFADFVFYPSNRDATSFIIELKKDKSADFAIAQIKNTNYALALKDYTGEKLAIGIGYNRKSKKHEVKIEEL